MPGDILVNDLTLDSRAIAPGGLFLALKGRTHHGLKFAEQAVARGARAVLYEDSPDTVAPSLGAGVFVAAVPQLSQRASAIADRFFGAPSQSLTMAGITGTNGKTTCAWLLAQALQFCGRPAAYMGTLGYGRPPTVTATEHTTSDAVSVQRHLAALRSLGAECVSMEVSSHALDQDRVAAVRFNTAAFTNLTRDHLDYHGTMEAYGLAKARLFVWPSLVNRVINVDDAFGLQIAAQSSAARLVVTSQKGIALKDAEYVRASRVTPDPAGLVIGVDSSWGPGELTVRLIGEFNVDNVLTVLAVLLAWNIPLSQAIRALEQCRAASGRMEMFGGRGQTPLAIVDYAHTPDALEKTLSSLRQVANERSGKLWCVFGCGGDRDPGKRPEMGAAAMTADHVVVTSDNPRSEEPKAIIAQIIAGMGNADGKRIEIEDRAAAILWAVRHAAKQDVVLLAGKGHETYQEIKGKKLPFADADHAALALAARATMMGAAS